MKNTIKPKAKILHIITSSDPGGAQRHLYLLAKELTKLNYSIEAACGPGGSLLEELEGLGVKGHFVPPLIKAINPWMDVQAILKICKIIKSGRYDLVHCHSSKAGVVGRIAAWLTRVPVVFTAHGYVFSDLTMSDTKRKMYEIIERLMANISDLIIAVSDFDKVIAVENGIAPGGKIEVIKNGIELSGLRDIPIRQDLGQEIHIGTITRLVPEKGLGDFIEAASIVIKNRPQVKFLIAGDGRLMDMLADKIDQLKLGESIQLLGYQEDIVPLLKKLDIFVMSSVKEGLPLALLEAMAAGKPVVSTSVGGIPEVLTSDRGVLVPPCQPSRLAEAIISLIDNNISRISYAKNARDYVCQSHDSSLTAKELDKVYLELISDIRK